MSLNITHWQHDVNSEEDEVSTLTLRSHTSNNPSALEINIKRKKYPQTDFLFLQLSNNLSHAIFQSFVRASQCCYFTCPDDVLRRSLATVTVYGVKALGIDTGDSYHILMGGKALVDLTGDMTQAEVVELYIKAVHFVSRRQPYYSDISHFYRNKSEEYFNNIMRTDGVMHKYDKNWGGDQASTLNKQVKGLFFSAAVDPVTRLPPDISHFGPLRLHVPTYFLLNNNINMYFSDFYCHYVNHKVQIVLVVKESPTDRFCRQRLVLVDQTNNPFLMRVRCGFTEIVQVTMNVTVEVFYTEDVPVKAMHSHGDVYFTRTEQIGKALSMINGIPKNSNCRTCNLDCFLLAHNML